jgi:hypothetical protein
MQGNFGLSSKVACLVVKHITKNKVYSTYQAFKKALALDLPLDSRLPIETTAC